MKKCSIRFALLFTSLTLLGAVHASNIRADILARADVQQFIEQMVSEHDFKRDDMQTLFKRVKLREDIIQAITRPAEGKPWYQYRPIFITEKRIQRGVEFWNKNEAILKRAEATYGVPAEIITAIIGVETFYGRFRGKYRVMDSLSTLAFNYPKRSSFFKKELKEFLLMAREEKVDPMTLLGSYAGAMGQPQFISSSFRAYAVDFDKDGRRDLWDNPEDVIGSVAYYFKAHGWQPDQPITSRAKIDQAVPKKIVKKGIKPHTPIKQLNKMGIRALDNLPDSHRAALIELENRDDNEYWLGLKNFYVITRYNHSELYAMAVYQLSEEIKKRRSALTTVSLNR